ncbi:MAG: hypothetical protein HN742_14470 [Lentisphaerae bacterium]|jgi:hypothetical protein|nr:hypothetical protein [Lentisphaerota bacterium]MBT4816396.1 hypothetical protein [Lentisphaerota bacterium]MBT5606843.1 hypothetical protein [Lentisphaerota bacterium]MBT7055299.1 hypothetical protein [Lentisphaerota bacterium]MBT7843080.1 hypothetical protein [Lentisphaerota bacterium]
MDLITLVDRLLRDRPALYDMVQKRERLRLLCGRLLLIFCVTTAVYGAVMGGFRCLHPAYFFSDFELVVSDHDPIRGKVAALALDTRTVYTHTLPLPEGTYGTVRFNLSEPSEPYEVYYVGEAKGYGEIVLSPSSMLSETALWRLPLIVAVKTPLLFLLTLLICSLALYVINLVLGLRLHFLPTMALALSALTGTGVVLAGAAPIAALFTIVTESYHFMKMFHVVVFAAAGLFGVRILWEGMIRMQASDGGGERARSVGLRVRLVLLAWLFLYAFVGAQLAWTLKPFLGTPYLPATPPFRLDRGNIFVSTLGSAGQLRRD